MDREITFETYSTRLCFRTGQAFRREENKDEVLEGKFRNLIFSPSTKKTTIKVFF